MNLINKKEMLMINEYSVLQFFFNHLGAIMVMQSVLHI